MLLMGKSQCDQSAAACISFASDLTSVCACYESWDYCYVSLRCGWTPLIGCEGLEMIGTDCTPYNCWSGKIIGNDGVDLPSDAAQLGHLVESALWLLLLFLLHFFFSLLTPNLLQPPIMK